MFKKTRSTAPIVLAIVGGILGLFGGACFAMCGEVFKEALQLAGIGDTNVEAIATTYQICGYAVFIFSIAAIVGGSVAKNKNWGSFLLTLSGVGVVVAQLVLIIATNSKMGGAEVESNMTGLIGYIIQFSPAILMLIGGIVGILTPKTEAAKKE